MGQELVVINAYQELLDRPAFEPSLAFHPKAPRHLLAVISPYRFAERITCGIESCHQPHLTGYLISTSDDKETAIGRVCGKAAFGVSFEKMRRQVDEAVTRQRRIQAITALLNNLDDVLPKVARLEQEYRELVELKQRLHGAISQPVYDNLRERALRGNPVIEKQVPMTGEEAAAYYETNNKRARRRGDPWPTKPVFLARLRGAEFFNSQVKVMLLTNLIEPMRQLSATSVDDVALMRPRALAATAKWVGEVPLNLAKAQSAVSAGQAFFQPENLQSLVHLGADSGPLGMMIESLSVSAGA